MIHYPEKHHDNGYKPQAPPPRHVTSILSPQETCEALVESAVARHHQRIDILFLKAVWGGILLSYGGFLQSVVGGSPSANENNPGLLRLVEGLVFPVGLSLIVLIGAELLTSDMMIMLLGVVKGRIPWWGLPYNYFVVFWGNLAGSLFFGAIFIRYSGLASGPVETFITNTAATRGSLEWHQVFLRGIGCNIMVCLAVFVAQMSSDLVGKVFGIYFVLSAFVVSQFEHVVADMFVIPLGMMLNKSPSVAVYIWKDILGALIGNIVGGWLIGISLYWFYLHHSPQPAKITDNERGPDVDSNSTIAGEHGGNPNGRGSHF